VLRCIDRKGVYTQEQRNTPSTQPTETSLGEQQANFPGPACAHDLDLALIVSSREATEGCTFSKTAALRCLQIHHVVSMISNEVPLRSMLGLDHSTVAHQACTT
jgi:hypothetical protein